MKARAAVLPLKLDVEKIASSYKSIAVNMGLIAMGSIIYSVGMNSILVPQGFLNGGIVGIALLVHYLVPSLGVGVVYFLLNIPLAVLGWLHISRRFMMYSIFGICFFSFTAVVVNLRSFHINDPILAALMAGVICGSGGGIILRSLGSAGGLDIMSVFLNKKFGLRIGSIFFASNALVLLAGAYFCDLERALYSIIFLFTSGKVMDAIITGFNRRKSLLVISDHAEAIAGNILQSKGRGVTFLNGEGAFTKREKKVIFTITSLTELPKMKELILSADPEAFIVVNDTLEVLGKRHGKGRVY
jgi:uncharacterized membrane-anchored protein YitT (DUF2179 family)